MPLYNDNLPPGALGPDFLSFLQTQDPQFQIASEPNIGPIASVPQIDVPEVKRPGLLGRIRQQPGGSRALLAFGAKLLSSKDFFSGFGNAALAYQQVLDEEANKLKPQLTKDSTFTYRYNPETGKYDIERTPVADYEQENLQKKYDTNVLIAKTRDEGQTVRNQQDNDTLLQKTDKEIGFKEKELDYKDRWNRDDNDVALDIAKIKAEADRETAGMRQGKPPSAGIEKIVNDLEQGASKSGAVLTRAQPIVQSLRDGSLQLGVFSNLKNKASAATGFGVTESTKKYADLQQFVESLRNAILIDNKGVQTDGDAERAKLEILIAQGDAEIVAKQLENIMQQVERGRQYALGKSQEIKQRQGMATVPARRSGPKPSVSNW